MKDTILAVIFIIAAITAPIAIVVGNGAATPALFTQAADADDTDDLT
jgi:hypothetical protein